MATRATGTTNRILREREESCFRLILGKVLWDGLSEQVDLIVMQGKDQQWVEPEGSVQTEGTAATKMLRPFSLRNDWDHSLLKTIHILYFKKMLNIFY